jgi:UDP-3-O-[3-hydroxymyristoyl] glucosamine N-acyltransferase
MLTAKCIATEHADVFTFLSGDLEAVAAQCRRPEEGCSASLVYVSDAGQLAVAARTGASIIIVHRSLTNDVQAMRDRLNCVFSVAAISTGMAQLLKHFDCKRERFAQWGERHATAVVHPSATIGANVLLGPYCVIGAGTAIADGCCIGAHVVVENNVTIGADTILHPHVFIGAGCIVGSQCEIHPHTSVGSDGFGYAVGAGRRATKIPHLGIVTLGDRVEIGSNCAIDRATITSTHIRSGTKLDNICHIAHNCDLGEDGLYTAGFMMAGSTTIGKRFMTGGNSVVGTHLTLADDVSLAGRSTVTNDVKEAGQYGGYPLQPVKDALKTIVSLGQINDIRKNLNKVMKRLGI